MFCLHGVVVMPDHVHLVATPLSSPGGEDFLLSDILRLIKGRSARRINRELGCSGAVWQAESFDHVLRSDESAESKVDYLLMNPVRRRLVTSPEKYPWTWRRTVEPDGTARVDGGHVAQASACGRSDGVRGG
jgi:REP element-mobilizing transposase RayT